MLVLSDDELLELVRSHPHIECAFLGQGLGSSADGAQSMLEKVPVPVWSRTIA